jgi:Protein of unknown function (DUF1549)/Protein of unknown function (DUF1553)/Concanavalin A-like lectin/glucanases superfamily/Planctomycete cytochrome C
VTHVPVARHKALLVFSAIFPSLIWLLVIFSSLKNAAAAEPAGEVRFNRDIRPILAEACFHCHGPDPASRKAKMRFDREEDFFSKHEKGQVVVKGKPLESLLYQRIITTVQDDIMPPPDAHVQLKPEQKELFRRWIEQGASWQKHWSFIAPERPVEPKLANPKWVRNPIDQYVLAALEAAKLQPAPEADRATLARRLSLDLTGLPPTPAQVDAFVADKRPDAYEKLVDQLIASPHYGEHRARYWLDAARYADTNGMHFDNYREIWPYRDWVINAFNTNQKFDQFTIEQIAGDLLPNPTIAQKIATGFHRCNMTTGEGGTIEEENLVSYARDRVETTSWVWLGLTANCAVCHDHKFDPISQRDFYAMSAYFRNTSQPALDGNAKDSPPVLRVPKEKDRKRLEALSSETEVAKKKFEHTQQEARGRFDKWLKAATVASWDQELAKDKAPDQLLPLVGPAAETALNGIAGTQALVAQSAKPVAWDESGPFGPAVKVDGEMAITYPSEVGDFEKDKPYSVSCWLKVGKDTANGAIFGRMDNEDGFRGWDLFLQGEQFATHLIHRWDEDALKVHTKDNTVRREVWQHVCITHDGSAKPKGLKIYVDGKLMGVDSETKTTKLMGTTRTTTPFKLAGRKSGEFAKNVALQQVQFYHRAITADEVARQAASSTARTLLATAPDKRDKKAADQLYEFMKGADQPLSEAKAKLSELEAEAQSINNRSPAAHIQDQNGKAMAHILMRGAYDKRGDEVEPAVFHSLHPQPANAPKNRLGLAQWLVAPDNGLTARVTINRVWQEFFGTGIVKSSEDFGIMGDAPSNPALLDWLAVEFRSDWDYQRMIKLIVTSATYRQAAIATPEKIEKDPANHLLSRGPRFRMDAEVIRDYVLSVSGLLVPTIGGASVKPYQPPGVWDAVGMRESNTKVYQQDTGSALYRRSMYSFWKRMAPPASLEILNATNRETACLRRERTNTPLQALVTLNDPQFVEAARVLAEQILKLPADKQVAEAGHRTLLRSFTKAELPVMQDSYAMLRAHYGTRADDVKALLTVGEQKADSSLPSADLAAMTMLCNELLNLDEALNK